MNLILKIFFCILTFYEVFIIKYQHIFYIIKNNKNYIQNRSKIDVIPKVDLKSMFYTKSI